jgi:hypothetical protein
MAKVRFGPVVGDTRGSIESTTFSRNRAGAYIRHRTAPVQPRTPRQVGNRQRLLGLTTTWRARSPQEQADWAALGAQIVRTDSLGLTYTLTGAQAYVGLNVVRQTAGLTPLTTPPAIPLLPGFTVDSVVYAAGAFTALVTSPSTPGVGFRYRVWAAAARSAGRTFVRPNDYVLMLVGADDASVGTAAALAALTSAYNARFGPAAAGQFIPVAVDLMHESGFVTPLQRFRVIAS